jgi:thiol-disulfide isomerase/thioredoxin
LEKKKENKAVNAVYAAVFIGLLLFVLWRWLPVFSEPKPEQISFVDEAGREFSLSDFSGKPLLVHFYASWCGPCMAEFPEMVAAWSRNPDMGLIVLTDDSWEKIKSKQAEFNSDLPIYRLKESLRSAGVGSIPATMELDSRGVLVKYHRGAIRWDKLADF